MKYCVKCGKSMEDCEAYCSNCGTPVNGTGHPMYHLVTPIPGVIDPDLQYPSPACKLAMGVIGIIYGLGLFGGGIYCIFAFMQYNKWAIAGGIGSILAGVLCIIHSIGLIRNFSARKKSM